MNYKSEKLYFHYKMIDTIYAMGAFLVIVGQL